MKNLLLYSTILVLMTNLCECQSISNLKCETLELSMKDHYRDLNLVDYVARNNQEMSKFIELRNSLTQIEVSQCNEYHLELIGYIKSDTIAIRAEKTKIKLEEKDIELFYIDDNSPTFIEYINGERAFGLFSDERNIEVITQLSISKNGKLWLNLESEVDNLLFPNFCFDFSAIKPLSFYKSKDEKYLYIYIFGNNGVGNNPKSLREVRSFMAKLVIDMDKGYLGSIILGNAELGAYQWDCNNFQGF